jgi:hypothetical protein
LRISEVTKVKRYIHVVVGWVNDDRRAFAAFTDIKTAQRRARDWERKQRCWIPSWIEVLRKNDHARVHYQVETIELEGEL